MGWPRWQPGSRPYGAFVSGCITLDTLSSAHVGTSESYGSQITVAELQMEIENHKSLREDRTSMLVFGNGDGGGGPLPQMVRSRLVPIIVARTDKTVLIR